MRSTHNLGASLETGALDQDEYIALLGALGLLIGLATTQPPEPTTATAADVGAVI